MMLLLFFFAMAMLVASAASAAGQDADISAADYPSIQAALDALPAEGGRVYIPAGTYILKGSLKPRDNVTISGVGAATIL